MVEKLWIGLIGIKAIKGTLLKEGAKGYTNLILLATDKDDFNTKAIHYFMQYNIEIFEFEDIAPFDDRKKRNKLHKSLYEISEEVLNDKIPRFGTVHLFENYDE